ncbi:MAG TPA: protoporphyrinogen oxidase HemJ [Chromatiales bacterium]|nr:protoporphyrinogen oxidase HemJ [Thiotrichales bacterium]HIP69620.1 protoporphyrinogen oxidase HemJ [Chromatiales bacterium]
MYLWLKALHIIFMVTWFAGLFYLPRLYVYHAMNTDPSTSSTFKVMEKKLFIIMTIGAVITAIFGFWVLFSNWSAYMQQGWMHVKLLLVFALFIYHIWCWKLMIAFRNDQNKHSHKWYRWFNEAPTVVLIVVIILAVLKPF